MAQLSGGSGGDSSSGSVDAGGFGEELGGDPAGDADQTTVDDADGGLDGPDTQDTSTDDTDDTPARRLRDDARSDPMSDPTEPEPSASEFEDNLDGGTETQPDTTENSPPDAGEQFEDELGGDPAGDTDRTTDTDDGPDPSDFDQELGGDPAEGGGVDDDTETGPSPGEFQDNLDGDTGSNGPTPEEEFGEELGGDPAGDADRTPEPTPDDVVDPGTGPEQGIEEGGATPEVEQQAQEFEQQILAENPGLTEEDVAISVVGTAAGIRFRAEFTEGAEGRVTERQRQETQDALEGIGFFNEQAEQQQELREEVEKDIEGQVGAGRAERAGITNPTLREGVIEDTDLAAGEDFTIDISETPEGDISVDAELTEEFRQEEAERAFQRALQEETGVRLEPGEEFRAVQSDDGSFEAEITDAGERTIRQEQPEQFGDIDWSLGMGDPETDEVETALGDASAAISGAGRDFASALFDEDGVASESLGEEILRAAGRPDLGRQYEEGLRSFGRGVAQSPFAIGNVPALAGGVLEGVEYAGYTTQQDLGTTAVETEKRAREIGSAAFNEITERPAEFAGLAVGTLGASYGIMRAAANVGPRTGLAARYAIQPGEELAGSAGFRITRRVSRAGERRAQQLFPNREPLIFSEEAAIRTARRVRSRLEPRIGAARSRATDVVYGEPETRLVRSGSSKIEGFEESRLVTERPGPLSQARAGASRLEDAFAGRTFAGVPVARRTELEGRETSVEAETETLLDDLQGPLRRMERAQESRASERRSRVESRFDVERNPLRSRARRRGIRTEAEVESDAIRRFEIAGQPTTEGIGSEIATEVAGREMLQTDTFAIQSERGRSDTFTETDTEVEQETFQELELEGETEQFLDLELELESEAEVETELEFEFETENEVEVEPFGGRTDPRDEDEPGGLFGEYRRLLERDLLNPLTGE